MSRDFFEQLTDPRRDPSDPCPSSASERQMAAELAPVLELLQRGAPPNGIDLSGRWRNYLAEQPREAPAAAPPAAAIWSGPTARRAGRTGPRTAAATMSASGRAAPTAGGWSSIRFFLSQTPARDYLAEHD